MKTLIDGIVTDTDGLPPELPRTRRGVFETVLWRGGQPVRWEQHWRRFEDGCAWAGLALPAASDKLRALTADLATTNGVVDGVVRFAHWRTNEGRAAWRVDVTPPRPHMGRFPFTVTEGPIIPPGSSNRAYKHLDRGRWLDALRAARADGFDETLLTDESRNAIEGGGCNVFFVRGGDLHTPALHLGPLPGIMRAEVISAARRFGLSIQEDTYRLSDVVCADEIWLTNSLIGVRPVSHVGNRPVAKAWPVLDRFRANWQTQFGWDPVVII